VAVHDRGWTATEPTKALRTGLLTPLRREAPVELDVCELGGRAGAAGAGRCRIIYRMVVEDHAVRVVRIEHRSDVY
jgi:hypothetical protein